MKPEGIEADRSPDIDVAQIIPSGIPDKEVADLADAIRSVRGLLERMLGEQAS